MTENEILELIAEHNRVEAEQHERRKLIFLAVDARKGYRRIGWNSSGAWSNCWGWEERLAIPRFVEIRKQLITDIELGTE